MQVLVNNLRDKNNLQCGDRADVYNNIDAKHYLKANGIGVFPNEYFLFIKYINGIISDDGFLWGVMPNTGYGFEDAVSRNEKLNRKDKYNVVVLGSNSLDWLVYDIDSQQYQMRSKKNDDVIHRFFNLVDAVSFMFKVYH